MLEDNRPQNLRHHSTTLKHCSTMNQLMNSQDCKHSNNSMLGNHLNKVIINSLHLWQPQVKISSLSLTNKLVSSCHLLLNQLLSNNSKLTMILSSTQMSTSQREASTYSLTLHLEYNVSSDQ